MKNDSEPNAHVQTAIRWRPAEPNREVSVVKVNEQVNTTNQTQHKRFEMNL